MMKSRMIKRGSIILAVGAIICLIIPLLLPYPPIQGAVTPEQLADPDSQFIQVNNITLHYKTYGQGNTVFILLHGTLLNTYSWHEVVESLSKLGRVIAYDRPPFGLASRPMPGTWKGESPYSYEAQTDLLIGLMDVLQIKQAILIGNSMGGGIAAYTAQRYPDRVQGLVLIAPAQTRHFFPTPVRWVLAAPQLRQSLGPLLLRSQLEKFASNLYRLSWHDPSKIQQEDWDAYLTVFKMENWDRAMWELLIAAKPFETILCFETITAPTLIITGDDDRVLGTQTNIQLADKISTSQLVVIPNCGHIAQEECPLQVSEAIEKWFNTQQFGEP